MEDFTINEMQEMQRNLQEQYKDKWESFFYKKDKFVRFNSCLYVIIDSKEVLVNHLLRQSHTGNIDREE